MKNIKKLYCVMPNLILLLNSLWTLKDSECDSFLLEGAHIVDKRIFLLLLFKLRKQIKKNIQEKTEGQNFCISN